MEYLELKKRLKELLPAFMILEEEPLSKHTSFRIGGSAELMVFPRRIEELQQIFALCRDLKVRPRVLGSGTNVLAPDEGVRGLVVVTRETFMGLELTAPDKICAMSGMSLAQTAMFAARNHLSGLEFAHGIPGSVGGGVYMNAGAYGGEIKDAALRTEFLHFDGKREWLEGVAQGFSYRNSAFQKLEGVILRTEFALLPGKEEEIRSRIHELNEKRRASQPLELPSAGSTFKSTKTGYAAALIEQAGLKGFQVGGAAISQKHAGFVVNLGGATAKDVLELVRQVKERVIEHSGVELEPEVRLWGTENES